MCMYSVHDVTTGFHSNYFFVYKLSGTYLSFTRCCHLAYCSSSLSPIISLAFDRLTPLGSIQHWSLAQGFGLDTSGGSVPIFNAKIMHTPVVFILSLSLQVGANSSRCNSLSLLSICDVKYWLSRCNWVISFILRGRVCYLDYFNACYGLSIATCRVNDCFHLK